MRLATRAIHVGQKPDPATGATVPPIHITSTYTQGGPGRHKGFEYSRTNNPTRQNYEAALAAVEGGEAAAAFASGLAATAAIVASLLRPGDSLVAYSDLYGGTYRLFEHVYKPWGLVTRYTDNTDPLAVAELVDATTKVIWLETPTNPMLNVLDIEHIREACREKVLSMGIAPEKVFLVVDNTFATPALQQPISLGADLVIHSATKYIGGHSDLVGGAVIAARGSNLDPIRFYQNAAGGVPSPFDCYLAHRGLKTLTVRMRQHCENAARIAEWLQQHPAIEKVIYPGLKEHPHHETAARQMCGFGGMVSCVVRGGLPAVEKVTAAVAVFACAESLGGVESLLNHPAIMTHASVPEDVRARLGIVDGLIRLSVGIEDVEDLIEDLDQALAAV